MRIANRSSSKITQLVFAMRSPRVQLPRSERLGQGSCRRMSYARGATRKQTIPFASGLLMGTALALGAASYFLDVHQGHPSPYIRQTAVQPSSKYASTREVRLAVDELRQALSKEAVVTDGDTLSSHGYSSWSTVNSATHPEAVVFPRSTEEIVRIAQICSKYRVPMTPYSGGTSLEGNFSTPFGGISIDMQEMGEILAVHPEDLDVIVQPCVDWADLNEEVRGHGLFFPVDPGPSARIGGMVGTNCSGTNAVRYGPMKDWVISVTVVLADGRIIKTRRRPRKSAAGYNLTSLFVGSEGTLGIVTEITLKLAVIPRKTRVAVAPFPSIRAAAAAAAGIIRSGLQIAAVEIMDEKQMAIINKSQTTKRVWSEQPTLFLKFSGSPSAVREDISEARRIAKQHHGQNFSFAETKEAADELWDARKQALWSTLSVMRQSGGAEQDVWSTDVAVPMSRLADIIELSKEDLDELGLFASILGHVGDGNFHESILYDKNSAGSVRKIKANVTRLVDRALKMDGTCTGEHGVGMGKKEYLLQELGEPTIDVLRSIKSALDPRWLMNPGKIFDWSDPR